jgi:hypothetical protein
MIRGGFLQSRPYIAAVMLPPEVSRHGEALAIWLLVDTGADRSLISPADYEKLGYTYGDFRAYADVEPRGYGGVIRAKAVPAKLLLRDDGGLFLQLAIDVDVVRPDPAVEGLPSILGRDVTDLFRLIIDRSVNLVALDDPEGERSPEVWPDEANGSA